MTVWTIADLHLAFGNPKKNMKVFPGWEDYEKRIEEGWCSCVSQGDLVLVPGDLSWAMKPEEALVDLDWIDRLPGDKLIIRGNHDYWWPSAQKLRGLLPPSIHFISNNAFNWKGITFGGARLWDTREYNFDPYINFVENPFEKKKTEEERASAKVEGEKFFQRELERLKLSLEMLDPKASLRIALTHYPPIGADLKPSRAAAILEDFGINHCVFGHLHNVNEKALRFGEARGVHYHLVSADYLGFRPIQILK